MSSVGRLSVILGCAVAPLAACGIDSDPTQPAFGSPGGGGGWDHNSSAYNLWLDGVRVGDGPGWTHGGTGPDTVSAASDWSFELRPGVDSACLALVAGRELEVVGSRNHGDVTVGPDVIVHDGAASHPIAIGEEARAAAWLVDSAGQHEAVVIDLLRGPEASIADARWLRWPQFDFHVIREADCTELAESVVVLAAAPSFPATAGGGDLAIAPGGFGAFATYYQLQRPSLIAKAAENGALPALMPWEDDDRALVGCSGGRSVASRPLLVRAALALGDGAWVSMPDDPAHTPVLALMTTDGVRLKLHAAHAFVDGLPMLEQVCWGATFAPPAAAGRPVARLTFPLPTATAFDVFHVADPEAVDGDQPVSAYTLLAAGRSRLRRDRFAELSENPNREAWVSAVDRAIEQARVGGVSGAMPSWQVAATALRGTESSLVAAEVDESALYSIFDAFDDAMEAEMAAGCGNGVCGYAETSSSCPGDCFVGAPHGGGSLPNPPGGPGH